MTEEEVTIRQKLKDDFQHFASRCLKIRTKPGEIKPFVLNRAQQHIHNCIEAQKGRTGKVRALILKGRQQGCSTYVGGRFYHRTTHYFGTQCFILTHSLDATNNLFKMAQRFYQNTPELVRPQVSTNNSKELIFGGLDSGYKIGTAENKSVGRSSTIQLFHGSEIAFWANASEHAKGILQAVPDASGTEIILESTANGVGNYFHQMWQKAEADLSDFIAIFVPWFWQDEYVKEVPEDFSPNHTECHLKDTYGLTDEQLVWRRFKIVDLSVNGQDGEKSFCQEYPCIVGSQRVGTDCGLLPISDIIAGYTTNTGNIMKQWCTGRKETIAIETALGYTLECTPDHRIATETNSFIEAQNSLYTSIKLSIPKFSTKVPVIKWNHLPCLESSLLIDEKFALFLGFFMGDGSYSGEVLSIAFNKNDPLSIETCKNLIVKLFGRHPEERKTSANGIELRVGIKSLKNLFFKLGIIEKKPTYVKRFVCVPDVIWRSPKNIIKQFLRGLFDSDGFAGYKTARISIFTKYYQFAKDIQLLLLGFGITCKRGQENKQVLTKTYLGNVLNLRASEARLFGKEIGFVSERKNARVEEWLDPKKIGRGASKIKYHDVVNYITYLPEQLVYDLEMSNEPHIFDANGICVHNCNSNEAFQLTGENTFIDSAIVMNARHGEAEKYGPLLIGVDPARFGDDRTSIIFRQGRVAFGLQSYVKKDTMEVTGIVHSLIEKHRPAKVFVDIGGLGAGVVDRLMELGHKDTVVSVNAGAKPLDETRYSNKRAEMWDLCAKWLQDVPCQIPDTDSLHADLCGIKYSFDSNSRLVMEKKEDMKRRGIRSPDESDALCLTFALPGSAFHKDEKTFNIAKDLARDLNTKLSARYNARK